MLGLLCASAGYGQPYTFEIIARSNTTIDGKLVTSMIQSQNNTAINNLGQIAWVATYLDPSSVVGQSPAIFIDNSLAVDSIEGNTLARIGGFDLNDLGTVAFLGSVVWTGDFDGVFTQNQALVQVGSFIDGNVISGCCGVGRTHFLNNLGMIVFSAQPGPAIFTLQELILTRGDTVDGIPEVRPTQDPVINNLGQTAVQVIFRNPDLTESTGIVVDGSFLVRSGDVIAGKVIYQIDRVRSMNDVGEVLFNAYFDCAGPIATCSHGLFTQNELIVTQGETVEGWTLVSVIGGSINNAGNVVYRGTTIGQPTIGVFTKDDGLVFAEEDIVEGERVRIMNGPADLNDHGDLAFHAQIYPFDQEVIIRATRQPPAPIACDADGNRVVDISDVQAILAARNTPALPGDPRDADGDGTITALDARQCVLQCTNPRCAP